MTKALYDNWTATVSALATAMSQEVARVADLSTKAVGLEQRIAALKVQAGELAAANREAADQLSNARAQVTAAQAEAVQTRAAAAVEADRIVADAKAIVAKMQGEAVVAAQMKAQLDDVVARLGAIKS